MARQAGAELLKFFKDKNLKIDKKSKHEIVTPADMASNKIILATIKKEFPTHGILSEETGYYQKNSDYLWIIDPLDGTNNFAMGNPLWGVSVALAYKKELVLGVINLPFMKDLFWAQVGQGAYLNNKKITVSQEKGLKTSLATFCFGYTPKSIRDGHKISLALHNKAVDARQLGSASVEMGWLAQGKTEAFIMPKVKLWDPAAGVVIVREAGGKVTDFKGKDWKINHKTLVGSNGNVHNEVMKIISKLS